MSTRGKNHPSYKEKLTYKHLHQMLIKTYGNPKKCEHCGKKLAYTGKIRKTANIHWANKSGKYLRNRSDWLTLCVSCHKRFDLSQ